MIYLTIYICGVVASQILSHCFSMTDKLDGELSWRNNYWKWYNETDLFIALISWIGVIAVYMSFIHRHRNENNN